MGWVTRTQVDAEEAAVAARETPNRARRGKDKARKGWSSFDEDATGDEAVEDDEEEMEEARKPKKKKEVAKAKKKAPKKVAKAKKAKAKKAKGEAWSVGMMVVVKGDATVRQRPSAKADEIYTAEKGEEMKIILVAEDDGKWVRVQHEDGTKGWIETNQIAWAEAMREREEEDEDDQEAEEEAEEESAVAMSDEDDDDDDDESARSSDDEDDDDGETRIRRKSKSGKLWYSVGANLAFVSKKQEFTSDSTTFPVGAYTLANNSPAVQIGAFLGKRFGSYEIAAEATYLRTVGGSGIAVDNPQTAEADANLAWAEQAIDVRAAFGYHLDKDDKYTVYARGGYHVNNVVVDESDFAKLPSETLTGFTVGLSFEAPQISEKIGVRAHFDYLLGGSLTQTAGYKDGDSATIASYLLGAMATYKVTKSIIGVASYNLAYEGYAFSGASEREATAVNGKRTDLQHLLAVGVRYQF
jgi:hypothetical protein